MNNPIFTRYQRESINDEDALPGASEFPDTIQVLREAGILKQNNNSAPTIPPGADRHEYDITLPMSKASLEEAERIVAGSDLRTVGIESGDMPRQSISVDESAFGLRNQQKFEQVDQSPPQIIIGSEIPDRYVPQPDGVDAGEITRLQDELQSKFGKLEL